MPSPSHLWVALKHEISYRRPTFLEDIVVADVIAEKVEGAKALFTTVIMRGEEVLAEVKSTWCCLDAVSLRPARLARDIAARFLPRGLSLADRPHPRRHRRLDLSAVARDLLPAQACRKRASWNMPSRASSARSRSTPLSTAGKARRAGRHGRKAAPDGFQFAVKGSRFCVTRPKLADAGEGIGNFLAPGLSRSARSSGRSCGCSPRGASSTATTSPAFLALLPRELDGLQLRHAIEPRHESFRDEAFFDLCREHDVAVVFGDDDEFPCIDADTASFATRACSGCARSCRPATTRPRSTASPSARGAGRAGGRDAYIFMINGAKESRAGRRAGVAASAFANPP